MKAALLPRAGLHGREAAWGKCDRQLCYFGGNAGKSGFLSFRRFTRFSRTFFCPAPQSLTLTVRGKLGWRLNCLLGCVFPPAR